MSKYEVKRTALRERLFPGEIAYEPPEKGFIKATRALPLVLGLLGSKEISGDKDPSRVYLELLGRCMDSGIVELNSEAEHAYAAGYMTDRGVRTWRERMEVLEQAGFIKTKGLPAQKRKWVLLLDIDLAVERLQKAKKVPSEWTDLYESRKHEVGYVPKGRNSTPAETNKKPSRRSQAKNPRG
jgi:hypothetical protein